jgi:hypothetical protein
MDQFPSGFYVGTYKDVPFYVDKGEWQCLFGWMPKRFDTLLKLKRAVTKWKKS